MLSMDAILATYVLNRMFSTLNPLGRRAHADLYPAEVYIVQAAGSSVQRRLMIHYTATERDKC